MYANGKKQAKRIARKIAEMAFDTEVLRNFLFDMDFGSESAWEEVVMDLEEIIAEFSMARDLAKNALEETKANPAPQAGTTEQVVNPFAQKHPQAMTADKNAPKDKAKGG